MLASPAKTLNVWFGKNQSYFGKLSYNAHAASIANLTHLCVLQCVLVVATYCFSLGCKKQHFYQNNNQVSKQNMALGNNLDLVWDADSQFTLNVWLLRIMIISITYPSPIHLCALCTLGQVWQPSHTISVTRPIPYNRGQVMIFLKDYQSQTWS